MIDRRRVKVMSVERGQGRGHPLSDSEETNGLQVDPEPEELDWDSFSTALEQRLTIVGILVCWVGGCVCVCVCE